MFSLPLNVARSITINKPRSELATFIGDFTNWPKWSPWLCQEPTCPVTFDGQSGSRGHQQAWDGKLIGAGKMTIAEVSDDRIDYDLEFLKPWKSKSKVAFVLKEIGATSTEVHWTMQGSMPIFLFFMRKMMLGFIGMDYERGLSMMKEVLETGSLPMRLAVLEQPEQREPFHWVGIRRECAIAEMPDFMKKDFTSLFTALQDAKLPPNQGAISFYHSYDPVKGRTEYTAAFTYSQPVPSAGFQSGSVPGHNAKIVDLVGPYRFLGNAWAAAGTLQRQVKSNRSIDMHEEYLNMPGQVPDADLHTRIIVPVR